MLIDPSCREHAIASAHKARAQELSLCADQDKLWRLLLWVNGAGVAIALSGLVWPLGWVSATAAVSLGLVSFSAYLIACRFPRWSTNLYTFGLFCGWVELLADYWLVHGTGTLVYPEGGPFVAASPMYMPFAWGGLITSNALLGVRLSRGVPLWMASIVTAAIVGVYVPLYEALAHATGWWHYRDTPTLGGVVPHYIIFGEALVGLLLPWAGRRLERASAVAAAALGAAFGLWILVSYRIGFALVG